MKMIILTAEAAAAIEEKNMLFGNDRAMVPRRLNDGRLAVNAELTDEENRLYWSAWQPCIDWLAVEEISEELLASPPE